jgi:hypothetical protein
MSPRHCVGVLKTQRYVNFGNACSNVLLQDLALDFPLRRRSSRAADTDFVEGIRFSLATAMVFLTLVLAAGFAWFPRGKGALADAEREEQALESEETAREGPL